MNSKPTLDSAQDTAIESSLLRHMDDLVSIVDHNYRYRAISRGYERFFGCTQQDLLGKTISEVHGEEIFHKVIKPAIDKTFSGEEVRFQFSRPNHAGEIRNLDSMHTIYSGPLTEGDGVAVVVRDITETVKANEALNNERQLLNTIIDSIPDFIFTKSPNGVYQTCNKSFAEFLGLSRNQIIGKSDFELMSSASAKYIAQRDSEVRNNQNAQRNDEWVTYQDGRKRLLDMHKMPLINDNNTDLGILGIGRNVTYEREAEQKLLMAALVFDSTPDPCIILEETGLIVSSNDAAQKQFPNLQNNDQNLHISDVLYCSEANLKDLQSLSVDNGNWCGDVYSNDNDNHLATINIVKGQARQADKFVLMIRDEGTHQNFADNLKDKAYQDALTGLPNRRLFFSRLESAVIRAERQFTQLAVLYIDLNNFKPINDQYGHNAGDQALIQVAKRLKKHFRSSDTLARLGGDEFVALVNIENKEQAGIIAEKVLNNLKAQLDLGNNIKPTISASIGISIFPTNAGSAEELLHKADEAMYKAKRTPDLNYVIYN